MNTYYKLVSLNPERYELIPAKKAYFQYVEYLGLFDNMTEAKSFEQWLKTEI